MWGRRTPGQAITRAIGVTILVATCVLLEHALSPFFFQTNPPPTDSYGNSQAVQADQQVEGEQNANRLSPPSASFCSGLKQQITYQNANQMFDAATASQQEYDSSGCGDVNTAP